MPLACAQTAASLEAFYGGIERCYLILFFEEILPCVRQTHFVVIESVSKSFSFSTISFSPLRTEKTE